MKHSEEYNELHQLSVDTPTQDSTKESVTWVI